MICGIELGNDLQLEHLSAQSSEQLSDEDFEEFKEVGGRDNEKKGSTDLNFENLFSVSKQDVVGETFSRLFSIINDNYKISK